jgi:hypothetical protein
VTPTQRTDEEIADFLIGEIDLIEWGWAVINARYARAYKYAMGVATPIDPAALTALSPPLATRRADRIRKIIVRRWAEAAASHPDPLAKPSLFR